MRLTVFTKQWPDLSPDVLGEFVSSMGFAGIEYPLREGFQVELGKEAEQMPGFVAALKKHGVCVSSIAGELNENAFAACRIAGAGIIRIMLYGDAGIDYMQCEDNWVRQLEAVYPLCEKYGVKIGIQNHFGHDRLCVFTSMELRHILDKLDPRYAGAVWDAGHCALAYEVPEQGLDIVWDRLILVNLKNGYVKRYDDYDTDAPRYRFYMTKGEEGAISWERIVNHLKKRGYDGDLCLTAEYTRHEFLLNYLKDDVEYLKRLGV